ncbi:hypothetical protein PMAC_001512 [Pneumocystis sp. 'macacae']|nr:hypothetical protein PMAC_001512 [Pneumocystis sp. 'macacae']
MGFISIVKWDLLALLNEKPSTRRILKSSARAVARAVKRRAQQAQNVYEDEEILLALIVKKDYKENKCKESLEKYCKELKSATLEKKEIHKKLEGLCENGKQQAKCTELKDKITQKCTEFKDKLKTEAEKDISNLKDEDCKKNEQKCLFLEAACPTELKDDCNKLRNKCYQRKRDEVAEKVLLRALSGSLKKEDSCKEKLKEVCPELSGESDELTVLCFDEKTCGSLIAKKESICESLKNELKDLEKKDGLETKCLPLLKKCYFYSTDCNDKDKPQCEKLKSSCEEKGIIYEKPGSDFEPTRPGLTVTEEIELQELYGEAARDGVYIGRPPTRDATELLLLLSRDSAGTGVKENCEKVLNTKCKDLKEYKLLKGLCNDNGKANDNGTEECTKLEEKQKDSAKDLTTKIGNKYLFGTKLNTIVGWHGLPTFISEKDCRTLESDCLYFGGQGGTDNPCSNLRAACYKKGLDAVANEALQHELRGSLQGSNGTWLENLEKGIVKACKELKGLSDELFVLCMDPKSTALTLSTDLRMRAVRLQELLNERRDFPTTKDCKELEKKCEDLGPDSREIGWPCHTLNQNCRRLESAEQMEEVLLKEKTENLDDFDQCVESLRKQCNAWNRRNRFALACLAQNVTCRIITKSVESKCAALDGHMKTEKVVENAKDDKKESLCSSWWPYCNKYMSSCKNLMTANDGKCEELKKECETVIKRLELEEKALNELKGSLKTEGECKTTLDKYCTQLTNASNGLETLCISKEKGKENDDVRKELCKKLIEEVKKRCPELTERLIEASKELQEKEKEYTKIKDEAKEAMEAAKLVLVTTKATGNGSGNKVEVAAKNEKKFKLVKRDAAAKVHVTEKELKAFDLVSQALSLYVELKEECQDLLKDCGFKEECEKCQDACKTIESKCNELKPLEVTEHKVQIETKNITITIKETVGPGGEKTGDAEKCTSIRTTDTWITKTSTHTSTSTSTSTITSTVTLTSTRRCKPTRCTTGDEAGDVTPSGGLRMTGYDLESKWTWFGTAYISRDTRDKKGHTDTTFISHCVVGLNLARGAARAVKRRAQVAQNVYEDEDYLLALIVKENDLEENECKNKLKEYCEPLKNAGLKDKEIHEKFEGLCEDKKQEAKCKELKGKITKKCTEFKGKLETVAEKEISKLTSEDCKGNEQQCLFLEGACSKELTENCNKLRNKCYQKKKDEVAEEILLRALSDDLENANKCKNKIKNVCLALGQESNELMQKCFDTDSTCTSLLQVVQNKCNSLNTEIEGALASNDKLKKNGDFLLERCHFYGPSCKNNKCDDLKKKCEEEKIIYIPPGPDFDPTEPEITLVEKIGLQKLYEEATTQGVVIGRALERDPLDLLVFLSGKTNFDDTQCQNVLKNKCNSFKYLGESLKKLCENTTKHTDICKEYKQKFEKEKTALTTKIESRHFEKDKITLWSGLPDFLTENDCIELQSDCFYYEGQTSFEKLCKNVKATCYKRGLDALANQALQDKMRGKFYNKGQKWLETLRKELVNVCVDLRRESDELFVFCIQSTEKVFVLLEDLRMKTDLLQEDLNERRDFPTKQDCRQLLKKCEDLEQDSEELRWPCRTLKHHCSRLETVEHLENKLLEEKIRDLKNETVCKKSVEEQCNNWLKKMKTPFILACAAQNVTCKIITQSLVLKCGLLKKHIETLNVVKQSEEENKRESVCSFWEAYCDKFMFSCNNLIDNGNGVCEELKKNCKPYREKYDLETQVMYEFRGKLANKDKCRVTLDQYCTQWTKTKNKTLESLCTASSANDNATRDKLCEKLVGRAKARCGELSTKLETAKGEIKTKVEGVKELNEEAKKASESANLILSRLETKVDSENDSKNVPANVGKDANSAGGSNTDQKTQFRFIRRGKVEVLVTEAEIKAFEAVSKALEAYIEVNEECRVLKLECGFKEECPACKDACNAIEKECNKLEPLEVKKHKVQTETKNITTTVTSTVEVECGEGGVVGNDYFGYDLRANEHGWEKHVVGQNLARGVERAVKRRAQVAQNVYEEEDYLLALILKKENNLEEAQCKQELKEYCKNLRGIDGNFDVNPKLKDTCTSDTTAEGKCTGLKNKVKEKCTEFEAELKTAAEKQILQLKDTDCKENEKKCLLLEAACPDKLKEKCNDLRNKCYQKKRDEVAEEALLRALSGNLENNDKCKKKLQEVCPELGQESDELTKKCIYLDYTCGALVEAAKKKCESLKTEVEKTLKTDGELQKKGESLLKGCHFYGPGCKDSKCDELKEECKKAEIVYTSPGSEFDPTRPEPTLAEKIGLEELYEEAATHGVLIRRGPERDPLDLIVLLSGTTAFTQNQCKTILTGKCESFKYLAKELKDLCDNTTERDNNCKELDEQFKRETKTLTATIKNKHFKDNEITLWSEIDIFLTENDCIKLQSVCFYYEGQTSFETLCKNVKAVCYKKGLDALANEALQKKLRGKLNDEIGGLPEELYKELIEVCKDLKNESKELFALCIEPVETVFVLLRDLHIKTNILQEHLDAKRDLPTRQHCTDLLKKCADLEQDSKHIEWPCRTLRHHCARLGVAEQLEEKLLAERVADLDRFDSCVETLRGRCSGWGRRGRTRYALGCVAPNATCTYLTQNVGAKCAVLGERMEKSNVVDEVKKEKNEKKKDDICERWMPFCSRYMYSCKNLTTDDNKYCKGLQKECDSFIKQQELEIKVLDELKGSLKEKDKCKTTLDGYCTQWANATNKLSTLCTKKDKDDTEVRKELCEKLIEKVKKQCPELKEKLTKAKEELEKKEKEYKDIKDKAVEAMKAANLVLATTNVAGNKAENQAAAAAKSEKRFKLVRRDVTLKAHVTQKELEAFDLVSQTFSFTDRDKEYNNNDKRDSWARRRKDRRRREMHVDPDNGRLGHTHIDTHKHIDVHIDDDIDGDADVDPAVQADEVHDRGRGRRGEAEWGAEDARVGREGGVVGDDDFGYDLGWVGIFGKACIYIFRE